MSKAKKSPQAGAPRARLKFVTSSIDLRGCPTDARPEVALIGRSNSGKSSLLNGIAQERVAMISSTPGKTRLLNFFDAGPNYRYVDMPGYGWSARGGEEHHSWKPMIEGFLGTRANLVGLLVLLDVRRNWTEDEGAFLAWLRPRGLPVAVVVTKTDKVTKSELQKKLTEIRRDSGVDDVFATSALKNTGFFDLEEFLFNEWVKPALKGSRSK